MAAARCKKDGTADLRCTSSDLTIRDEGRKGDLGVAARVSATPSDLVLKGDDRDKLVAAARMRSSIDLETAALDPVVEGVYGSNGLRDDTIPVMVAARVVLNPSAHVEGSCRDGGGR